jgi:malate dehydrogenase
MRTVAIIGAGEIGGATAMALAAGDQASRVLLVDPAGEVAAGKALDIQQSGAIGGFHCSLSGTADETRVTGCGVCVIADRVGSFGEWRDDDGLAMLGRLTRYLGGVPIVFAGASQAGLLGAAARELLIPRARLIGSAPEALTSCVRAIVALEARCSPGEVSLAVLGRPPAGFVVPWSGAAVGGYPLERVVTQAQLARIAARVTHLWPPGPNALGAAAAMVAQAILSDCRRSFSVLSWLDGEFGARRVVGALPVRMSSGGIAAAETPEIGPREAVRLKSMLGE